MSGLKPRRVAPIDFFSYLFSSPDSATTRASGSATDRRRARTRRWTRTFRHRLYTLLCPLQLPIPYKRENACARNATAMARTSRSVHDLCFSNFRTRSLEASNEIALRPKMRYGLDDSDVNRSKFITGQVAKRNKSRNAPHEPHVRSIAAFMNVSDQLPRQMAGMKWSP